jgi:uncharacterized protein (TIGR00255 family)
MLRSMTGFATSTVQVPSTTTQLVDITMQLKSLNARYFEVTCKMPYQLNSMELDITRTLQEKLYRGHLYFTLYVNNQDIFKGTIKPSLVTIDGYLQGLTTIKQQYNLSGDIALSDLVQLDGIFTTTEKSLESSTIKLISSTLEKLIQELILAQEKEGRALQKDLEKRIAVMHETIILIEKDSGTLLEAQKAKVSKALQELPAHTTTSLADIQKHAAYMLMDKMDINEEIVRFKTHLKNFTAQLTSDSVEKGKRLDFTLQEMAREINTIAAKCSDAAMSSLAITIKVELEKAREQTQNIV